MDDEEAPEHGRADPPGSWPDPDLVEYLVLTTSDLSSGHALASVLRNLVDTSQIRILDLVGVETDAIGRYRMVDWDSLPGLAAFRRSGPDVGGVLSDDDIALVSRSLGPRASALILVLEDRWARHLADAARVDGGRVVGGERIPGRSIEQSWRIQRSDELRPFGTLPAGRPAGRPSRRQRVDLLRRRPVLSDSVRALEPPR